MGISKKMTGAAWHVEKAKPECDSKRRNCFNCIHLSGHYCLKHHVAISNNNAYICKSFVNRHPVEETEEKNIAIDNDNFKTVDKTLENCDTVLIKLKDRKILYYVLNNKGYKLNAFINTQSRFTSGLLIGVKNVYLIIDKAYYKCTLVNQNISIIDSKNYITFCAEIASVERTQIKYYNKYYLLKGIDDMIGEFYFYNKFILNKKQR